MGPRSRDRGIGNSLMFIAAKCKSLQWGRGHVTAESSERRLVREAADWLQWGRGHVTAESLVLAAVLPNLVLLQWGRGHVTAESCD